MNEKLKAHMIFTICILITGFGGMQILMYAVNMWIGAVFGSSMFAWGILRLYFITEQVEALRR